MRPGVVVECKRAQKKNHRPRYKRGDRVKLRDGTVVTVLLAHVKDWGVEYDMDNGASIAQHHVLERTPR